VHRFHLTQTTWLYAKQMVVNPGVTYVSSKADALLLEKLKEGLGADPAAVAFDVRLEKASFFNPNNVRLRERAACATADCVRKPCI